MAYAASLAPVDSTRGDLIAAAIECFSQHGYEGASTRAIAAAAGKPMSAITYHFGGKHGLYLEAGRHVAEQVNAFFAPARKVSEGLDPASPDPMMAREGLRAMQEAAIGMLTNNEVEAHARFIIGEQADQSEAFTVLYDELMEPLFAHVARLMQMATGGWLDEQGARLRATMFIGQLFLFRVCRASVLRNMGWSDIGEPERAQLLRTARAQLDTMLDAVKREIIE
jgi:TetR/AcrR family transcriptional regulator, regulator of cefoperazone and chloramphenicol sensitivity